MTQGFKSIECIWFMILFDQTSSWDAFVSKSDYIIIIELKIDLRVFFKKIHNKEPAKRIISEPDYIYRSVCLLLCAEMQQKDVYLLWLYGLVVCSTADWFKQMTQGFKSFECVWVWFMTLWVIQLNEPAHEIYLFVKQEGLLK